MIFLPYPIYKGNYESYGYSNMYELEGIKFIYYIIIGHFGDMEGSKNIDLRYIINILKLLLLKIYLLNTKVLYF
jgi:hypothetical protein